MHALRAESLVVESPRMRALMSEVAAYADSDQPVVIEGETGVGKEVVARLLHQGHATRGRGNFVPVNCGAIPDGLFESLFFGHVRGAFSGAMQAHRGYFEQASGGTLFLDEIGELPLLQQVKLLRALEDGVVTRVGAEASIATDVRLVAATNRALREMVRAGSFRADLFYRIAVIEIHVPNLQERGSQERGALLKALMHRALDAESAAEAGPMPEWLVEDVTGMPMPGNIRQLRNVAERIAVLVRLERSWNRAAVARVLQRAAAAPEPPPCTLKGALERPCAAIQEQHHAEERQRIVAALLACEGRRQEAASMLGISRKSLWEKMRRYQLG